MSGVASCGEIKYHVYFLFHLRDQAWVQQVIERLEAPELEYVCGSFPSRDTGNEQSVRSAARYALQVSMKTVLVLSPDFMRDTWTHDGETLFSDHELRVNVTEIIPILLCPCELPSILVDLLPIDARLPNWWPRMLEKLPRLSRVITFPSLYIIECCSRNLAYYCWCLICQSAIQQRMKIHIHNPFRSL